MSQPSARRSLQHVLKDTGSRARKRVRREAPTPGREGVTDLEPDGEVVYQPRLFGATTSSQLSKRLPVRLRSACLIASRAKLTAAALQEEIPWQARQVTVMGRQVLQPRLVAYMADDASLQYVRLL